MRERGIFAMTGMATAMIGQPIVNTVPAVPALQRQMSGLRVSTTTTTTTSTFYDGFNLTSADDDVEMQSGFSTSSPDTIGFEPYSTQSAMSALMNPLSLGMAPNAAIVNTWSQGSSGSRTSTERAASIISEIPGAAKADTEPFMGPPAIPRRNPAHTLNFGVLPIISAALPRWEAPNVVMDPTPPPRPVPFAQDDWEEREWYVFQGQYLQLDGTAPLNSRSTGCKWSRKFHAPTNKGVKRLAGVWEAKGDSQTIASIKTAPSVLA